MISLLAFKCMSEELYQWLDDCNGILTLA